MEVYDQVNLQQVHHTSRRVLGLTKDFLLKFTPDNNKLRL